jgi:hypothetical protein
MWAAVDGHRIDNRPVKCGLAGDLERQRRLWLSGSTSTRRAQPTYCPRRYRLHQAVHRLSVECVGFQALGALGLKAQFTAIHLVADAVVLGAQFVGERRHDLEEPPVALADRQFRQIRKNIATLLLFSCGPAGCRSNVAWYYEVRRIFACGNRDGLGKAVA